MSTKNRAVKSKTKPLSKRELKGVLEDVAFEQSGYFIYFSIELF